MEVKLSAAAVDCCRRVYSQTVRKEESMDSVVPDTLPDIGEVLCTTGDVLIRSKDVAAGRLRIEANVPARICCVPEEGGAPFLLDVNVPLALAAEDAAIPEGGLCTAELRLAALDTRVLNPRKVSVRAEVEFSVACYECAKRSVCAAPETAEAGIQTREREISFSAVASVTEKTFVLTDELEAPEGVAAQRIVGQKTRMETEEVRTVGSKLVVKGRAESRLLVLDERGGIAAAEFSTPFSQIIEAERLPDEALVTVAIQPSGTYYELTAAGRIEMELHLVAQATVRGTETLRCLTDAYSNAFAVESERSAETFSLIRRETVLHGALRAPFPTAEMPAEIVTVCASACAPAVSGGSVTLPLSVLLVWRTAAGSVCAARRSFSLETSAELIEGERLEIVSAELTEVSAVPSDGGAEVRVAAALHALLRTEETVQCITALRYDETAPLETAARPTLVLLRADSTADLWTIARENCSTVAAIREANRLDEAPEGWSRLLLIPKTLS